MRHSNTDNSILEVKQHFSYAVGRQIYLIRKLRGLTGKELAEKLGVSQQQVSRYERGVCRVDVDMLVYLLYQLDTSLDDFFIKVSLIIKNESPKIYAEYHSLFYPAMNMSHDKYLFIN
ncbi:helix-turn-helix domain-containing protein [Providencia sp. Je.9.19]|uniref:helix-turn-helix domain-containing protein n=1 Tax=Providencia sp. Je.9.19 TaxID=3142844 RepID=UPI003DA9AD08